MMSSSNWCGNLIAKKQKSGYSVKKLLKLMQSLHITTEIGISQIILQYLPVQVDVTFLLMNPQFREKDEDCPCGNNEEDCYYNNCEFRGQKVLYVNDMVVRVKCTDQDSTWFALKKKMTHEHLHISPNDVDVFISDDCYVKIIINCKHTIRNKDDDDDESDCITTVIGTPGTKIMYY